jgi:hypothetical protein
MPAPAKARGPRRPPLPLQPRGTRLAPKRDAQRVGMLRHDRLGHVGGRRGGRDARLVAGAGRARGAVGQQRQRRRQRGAALPAPRARAAAAEAGWAAQSPGGRGRGGACSSRGHARVRADCRQRAMSPTACAGPPRSGPPPVRHRPQARLLDLLRFPGVCRERPPPRQAALPPLLRRCVNGLLLRAYRDDARQGLGRGRGSGGRAVSPGRVMRGVSGVAQTGPPE